MEPDDACKTAFICTAGMYSYNFMPFGLCNAGATFQRLMDLVMTGLSYDICLCYIDDVIIFSRTISDHLDRLKLVLQRLQGAGLKLKPSKCFMLQQSVGFLGHLVSGRGIETHPDKIKDVIEWPECKNVRDVICLFVA